MSRIIIGLFFLSLVGHQTFGQEITLDLGESEIGQNQIFTITITVKNDRLKSYNNFPELDGFVKRGTSSSSSTNIINGQITTTQSITMNYSPEREGTFVIPSFTMKVNEKEVSSEGKTIKVGPAVQRRQHTDPFSRDPFEDLFGKGEESKDFVDVKEDAFLALSLDKNEVFVGEGVTSTLAFYVSESNRAPLQFYDLGRQVSEIVKVLKPENCWEENFNIENISGEPVTIQGKTYTQYKIYQATYFPLNTEPVEFPQVGLELIKFKVAKNPTFFGQNRKEDYKTFYSQPKTLKVKALPPHPLADVVAVGNFRLEEQIDKREVETGQSYQYEFRVFGEGNISSINMLPVDGKADMEIYEPNISQNINRRNNKVTGSKTFSYYGIPNEPGIYQLKDYFQWIYFNTQKRTYDTLASTVSLRAFGESRKNEQILSNDLGSFYDRISFEDNTLQNRGRSQFIRSFATGFILLLLVGAGFIAFKK
jgi:hypothetical protein